LPAIVVFGLCFGFVGWLVFNRNPQVLFLGAINAGVPLLVGGVIMGLVFGNADTNEGKMEMGHFMATRPMATPDMARTMLRVAGISVFVSWAIWAAALLGLYGILLLAHVDLKPAFSDGLEWWRLPLTLAGTWLLLSFVATIGQTGRPILLGILFCGVPALTAGVTITSHWLLTPEGRLILEGSVVTIIGLVFAFGTVWAFVAARRRLFIAMPTVWAAMGAWIALCVLLVLILSPHHGVPPFPLPFFALMLGLLALVVFPLAAAPLALAWNRHR
jgi:hypothetical protein